MSKSQFLTRVPTIALIVVFVIIAAAMIPLGFSLGSSAQTARDQATAYQQQRDQATTKANQGKTLAEQVQAACAAGGTAAQQLIVLGACHQATVVQQTQTPQPGPAGQNGQPGQNGSPGRGIVATAVVNGDLVLSYNQAPLTQDVGHIVGSNGTNGTNGRGIVGENLVGNDLVLTFDQAPFTQDVGPVVGAAGKDGVNGTNGTNGTAGQNGADGCSLTTTTLDSSGNLSVTYGAQAACGSNAGKTVSLGNVRGQPGQNGNPAQTETYNYANGTQSTCTRDSGSSPTSPTYTCTAPTVPTSSSSSVTQALRGNH